MSEIELKQDRSIELAKAGFENAQARIVTFDTKVSIAMGVLGFLLPAPVFVIGWITGLEEGLAADHVFYALHYWWPVTAATLIGMLVGMFFAFRAMRHGISCLSPRPSKGHGQCGPFHNEWEPNIIFPIHQRDKEKEFLAHLRKLRDGIDFQFLIEEYEHQLTNLGRILCEKFSDMKSCFDDLRKCMFFYGAAVVFAMILGLVAAHHATKAANDDSKASLRESSETSLLSAC